MVNHIGVVVIGRNEGERLKVCLQSVCRQATRIVYVDSGSTDKSLSYAISIGVHALSLDMNRPFTAGRARNKGFFFLTKKYPELSYVQFIDGDCELLPHWIRLAGQELSVHQTWAIVAGTVQERYPGDSVYNMLCDIEWNVPAGEVMACGGIFMIRASAFVDIGGFDPSVIAGEEPELCYRLRRAGWKIHRVNIPMALHDAAMTKFSQWWKRVVRGGHAYAQGCFLHGREQEHFRVRECARAWLWGLAVPLVALGGVLYISRWYLMVLLIYPLQFFRNYSGLRLRNIEKGLAFIYAFFMIIDKWPQLWGQLIFIKTRMMRKTSTIIEHKQ